MQALDSGADAQANPVAKALATFNQRLQQILDRCAPYVPGRWLGLLGLVLVYGVRVFLLQGFYIVTYGLGIYNLNLLLGFITPQVDPETEDGPELPTKSDQEFKPFVRRLPEFKFWCAPTPTRCMRDPAGAVCWQHLRLYLMMLWQWPRRRAA